MHSGEVERVYIELERLDGPWAGVADVGGVPHYFCALDGITLDKRVFQVWEISGEALALEQEQWAIFVRWNDRYEVGRERGATHPGRGGVDGRFDELEQLLEPLRQPPPDTRLLKADTAWLESEVPRYHLDGVDYGMSWRSVESQPRSSD